jgi:hypothetical protein
LYLMCTDVVLFRTNFFTTTFIAIPLYLLLAGLNQQHQMKESLIICPL